MSKTPFQAKVEEMATELEFLAKRVRNKASSRIGGTDTERALAVTTEINWGIANLPFEAMWRRALEADKEQGDEPK